MAAKLHLAENALALHLLLERLEGLVDVIVADEYLHGYSFWQKPARGLQGPGVTMCSGAGKGLNQAFRVARL